MYLVSILNLARIASVEVESAASADEAFNIALPQLTSIALQRGYALPGLRVRVAEFDSDFECTIVKRVTL